MFGFLLLGCAAVGPLHTGSRTFEIVDLFDRAMFDLHAGDVTMVGDPLADTGRVVVDYAWRGEALPELEVMVEGVDLVVHYHCVDFADDCIADVDLVVPSQTKLAGSTGAGDLASVVQGSGAAPELAARRVSLDLHPPEALVGIALEGGRRATAHQLGGLRRRPAQDPLHPVLRFEPRPVVVVARDADVHPATEALAHGPVDRLPAADGQPVAVLVLPALPCWPLLG